MRYDPTRGKTATFQREVLPGGDALHPVRSGDRVYVSMGGGLPRRHQTELCHFLEHVQLHFYFDGRIRLRAQKRRARLQEMTVAAPKAFGADRGALAKEAPWLTHSCRCLS